MVNTIMSVEISDYDFVFPEGREQKIKTKLKKAFNTHNQYRYEERSRFVTGDTELEVQLSDHLYKNLWCIEKAYRLRKPIKYRSKILPY